MCGIAGMWNTSGGAVDAGAVSKMAGALRHRGPDSLGTYVQGGLGLAHTRLSIIDLSSAGTQPFRSANGRYALVFNGEIYNYSELKETYFQEEHFISTSDTEVLLHILIRFGSGALPMLKGMFSFAFFDFKEERMILATDPFGKKPLVYTWVGDTFFFASEAKALFATHAVDPLLAPRAVGSYLLHEYIVAPETGFLHVQSLGGGQYMEITKYSLRIATWWKPETSPKETLSFQKALQKFDTLLSEAVERRMVADVPVGLFLSGGLDSSALLWYMRQVQPEGDIHSYSISFEDASFNEGHIAARVAENFHTSHHEAIFDQAMFLQTLQELIPMMDMPFADASLLPTHAVSVLARQHGKVVLDGDGSDELLGGYGTFDAFEVGNSLRALPISFWRIAEQAMHRALPISHNYFSSDFKLKSFARGMQFPPLRNLQIWLGAFTDSEIKQLVALPLLGFEHQIFDTVDYAVMKKTGDMFDTVSLYHIERYLKGDILIKIDRATMAKGLEARTPFLDKDFAEFVLRLPASYKRHKRILKELMKNRLPQEVLKRKKQGFGIPLSAWFASDLLSLLQSILSQTRVQEAGVFRYEYIERIIREHAAKHYDHRKKLWTLMMFQLWYEYWIMGKRDVL